MRSKEADNLPQPHASNVTIDFRKIRQLLSDALGGDLTARQKLSDLYESLKGRVQYDEEILPIVERNFRRTTDQHMKNDLETKSGELSDEIETFREIKRFLQSLGITDDH